MLPDPMMIEKIKICVWIIFSSLDRIQTSKAIKENIILEMLITYALPLSVS